MKIAALVFTILWISFSVFAQSDLNKIILNKEGIVDGNWVEKIQNDSEWEYIKTVGIKGKKISSDASIPVAKKWSFYESNVKILPYIFKTGVAEYSDVDIKYHSSSRMIVIKFLADFGKERSYPQARVFEIINLTDDYLVLEEVEDRYCFDYNTGRKLSKNECKERRKKEPKVEKLFGGPKINIGGKPPKSRLVFKRMN